jgi:hypothetical protein
VFGGGFGDSVSSVICSHSFGPRCLKLIFGVHRSGLVPNRLGLPERTAEICRPSRKWDHRRLSRVWLACAACTECRSGSRYIRQPGPAANRADAKRTRASLSCLMVLRLIQSHWIASKVIPGKFRVKWKLISGIDVLVFVGRRATPYPYLRMYHSLALKVCLASCSRVSNVSTH